MFPAVVGVYHVCLTFLCEVAWPLNDYFQALIDLQMFTFFFRCGDFVMYLFGHAELLFPEFHFLYVSGYGGPQGRFL